MRNLDIARDVLDHEIVDAEGVSCGMVDDVELTYEGDARPRISALLVGRGAWTPRLPALLQVAVLSWFGSHVVRVPWEEVDQLAETVRLKSTAASLRLARHERAAAKWIKHLPGA
jgi:sporulation protein YlmC with PRC-barrel domain